MFQHLNSKKKSHQLLLQQAALTHLEALGEEIILPQNKKHDNEESTSTTNLILPLNQHNHTVDYDCLLSTKIKNDVTSTSQSSKYHLSLHPHLLFLPSSFIQCLPTVLFLCILIHIAPAYGAFIIFIVYIFLPILICIVPTYGAFIIFIAYIFFCILIYILPVYGAFSLVQSERQGFISKNGSLLFNLLNRRSPETKSASIQYPTK